MKQDRSKNVSNLKQNKTVPIYSSKTSVIAYYIISEANSQRKCIRKIKKKGNNPDSILKNGLYVYE